MLDCQQPESVVATPGDHQHRDLTCWVRWLSSRPRSTTPAASTSSRNRSCPTTHQPPSSLWTTGRQRPGLSTDLRQPSAALLLQTRRPTYLSRSGPRDDRPLPRTRAPTAQHKKLTNSAKLPTSTRCPLQRGARFNKHPWPMMRIPKTLGFSLLTTRNLSASGVVTCFACLLMHCTHGQ